MKRKYIRKTKESDRLNENVYAVSTNPDARGSEGKKYSIKELWNLMSDANFVNFDFVADYIGQKPDEIALDLITYAGIKRDRKKSFLLEEVA